MIWFQFSDEAHGVRDHGERAREREQLAYLALMKPYIASSTVIKCINKKGGSDGSVDKGSYCTSLAGWVWHPEITQNPHTGRWRALTPQSSPLTFTHKVWYVHTSTHTQIKQYLIKKELKIKLKWGRLPWSSLPTSVTTHLWFLPLGPRNNVKVKWKSETRHQGHSKQMHSGKVIKISKNNYIPNVQMSKQIHFK